MYDPVVEIRGNTGEFLIHARLKRGKNGEELALTSASHRGDYGVTRYHTALLLPSKLHLSFNTYLESRGRIVFYTRWGHTKLSKCMIITIATATSQCGNEIINQSDRRLKTNIKKPKLTA